MDFKLMPKERFHILMADRCLTFLNAAGHLPAAVARNRQSYLLGSIFPDTLFYDLPFLTLSGLGKELHRLQGQPTLSFLALLLREERQRLPEEAWAWVLGMAGHLLADDLLHPIINTLIASASGLFPEGLSPRDCHHWFESELEGYWMAGLGPGDGYAPLLKEMPDAPGSGTCIRLFPELLSAMHLTRVPDAVRIKRCLFWQTRLLRLFSHPGPRKIRPVLLRHRMTRYPGALIVPAGTAAQLLSARAGYRDIGIPDVFQDNFITHAVRDLSGRLSGLAELL